MKRFKQELIGLSLKSWVFAWACSIFLSSALLAAADPQSGMSFPSRLWSIADEMAPLAKIMFGGLLVLVFALLNRLERSVGRLPTATFGAAAVFVPVIVMAIIPADYSRGFGIGYSEERFAIAELSYWMAGCLAGGLFYARARNAA